MLRKLGRADDQVARLIALDDEALAVELAAQIRPVQRLRREPLDISGSGTDWDECAARLSPRAVSPVSDDGGDGGQRGGPPAVRAVPPLIAMADGAARDGAGSGSVVPPDAAILFGCRLCSTLLPTTEAIAWVHVLKMHGIACEPTVTHDAIWGARILSEPAAAPAVGPP